MKEKSLVDSHQRGTSKNTFLTPLNGVTFLLYFIVNFSFQRIKILVAK